MPTKDRRFIEPGFYLFISLLLFLLTQYRPNTPAGEQTLRVMPTTSRTAPAAYTPTTTRTLAPTGPVRAALTSTATYPASAVSAPDYLQIAEMGKGTLPQIVRSPNGKTVLVTDGITLRVLRAADYSEIGSMDLGTQEPYGEIFAISPDSRYAVVSAEFYEFQVIEIATLKSLAKHASIYGYFDGTIFTPDSQHVLWLNGFRSSGGPYHNICRLDFLADKNAQGSNEWGQDCYPLVNEVIYHWLTRPAVSPDGRLVAAGYSDWRHNALYIWDVQSKTALFTIPEQPAEINSVAFSPDGRTLATGGDDGVIRLWNPKTGAVRRAVTGFVDSVTDVKFTPDGRSLRVQVIDQDAVLYDLASGKIRPVGPPAASPSTDPLAARMLDEGYLLAGGSSKLAFSPDGSTLAVAHGSIQIWDMAARKLKNTIFTPAPLRLTGMSFSPDGQRLAAITEAGDVLSWNVATGQAELNLTAQALAAGPVAIYAISGGIGPAIGAGVVDERGIVFSPDSAQVAIGSGSTVEIWDVASRTKARTLDPLEPAAFPTRLSYSADGKHIYAILNRNRDAAVWDAVSGKLIRRLSLLDVDANAFSATALYQNWFARNNYAGSEYWIEVWDLERTKMVKLPMPERETEPLRFSADGRFLLAVVSDRIYLWQVSTGQLALVTENTFDIGDLALSPDGKTLVTVDYGKATLWDVGASTSAAMSGHFTPAAPPPTQTPYSSDKVYPTITPQPTLAITPLPAIKAQAGAITASNASQVRQQARFGMGQLAQMSWEGSDIYVTGAQGVIRYTAASLQETARVEVDTIWVSSSRALTDGRLLVAGNTRDGKVQLWEASGPKLERQKMLLEASGTSPTAISPDGKWWVFSTDKGLATRDIETGLDGIFLRDRLHDPLRLVFSSDGRLLAAARSDYSVRIYDFVTGTIANGVGGPEGRISQIAFDRDNHLLMGAAGGSAWTWSVTPGEETVKVPFYQAKDSGNLALFDDTVTAVALHPDSILQAIASSKSSISLYDRAAKRVVGTLTGHNSAPVELAFSPDGSSLASIDRDGGLIVWDLVRQAAAKQARPEAGVVRGLVARQDSGVSAWGANTIWRLDKNTLPQHITGLPSGLILGVSGAADLAATYRPYQVSLYDAGTGKYLKTLPEEAVEPLFDYRLEGLVFRQFNSAIFSADGARLATVGSGGMWVYDLPEGTLVRHLEGDWSKKAAISRDGNRLVACPDENMDFPKLYNLQTGEAIDISGRQDDSNRFGWSYPQYAISADMRYVGAVNYRSLLLINPASGQVERELAFEEISLTSLALNPNASMAAVGREDGTIHLVDLAKMKVVAVLAGHKGSISTLVFSQDGRRLYSVGAEGVVKAWGLP